MPYLKQNQNQNRRTDISSSLNEIGNTFGDIRQNIPHIVIGNQGINTNTQKPKNNAPTNPIMPISIGKRTFDPSKMFNYGFYLMILIVVGYAIYRLIMMFLGGK